MPWKNIIVHLDDEPSCTERVRLAIALASQHGSHLVGLAPTGLPDLVLDFDIAAPEASELSALFPADLSASAQARAQAFEHEARGAGALRSFESRIDTCRAVDAIARAGRCSDLVIVGQTDRGSRPRSLPWDLPQQVIVQSGSAVLVVPCAGHWPGFGASVLVAWQDVPEAGRAVRAALPLLAAARRVVLLQIAAHAGHDDRQLSAAKVWLAQHAIDAEARIETSSLPAGAALLVRMAELGCDALVMGAYGHTRLREWVLGGATRHILDGMTAPTLFSA
jgi:nucleotide-binding universal stress UspA family protein